MLMLYIQHELARPHMPCTGFLRGHPGGILYRSGRQTEQRQGTAAVSCHSGTAAGTCSAGRSRCGSGLCSSPVEASGGSTACQTPRSACRKKDQLSTATDIAMCVGTQYDILLDVLSLLLGFDRPIVQGYPDGCQQILLRLIAGRMRAECGAQYSVPESSECCCNVIGHAQRSAAGAMADHVTGLGAHCSMGSCLFCETLCLSAACMICCKCSNEE